MPTKKYTEKNNVTLEPRVAKLEVGLDRLTDDVRDLAGVVRQQGATVEQEIQKLVIAVTQAAGPRKVDWSVIISSVILVMAIGSAVFWPLNQTSQNNKSDTQLLSHKFENHIALPLHPVGNARIDLLEKNIDYTKSELIARDAALDVKIQKETQLMSDVIGEKVSALKTTSDLKIENLQLQINLLQKK